MHTNLGQLWEGKRSKDQWFFCFVFVLNKVLLRTPVYIIGRYHMHSSLLGFALRTACSVTWPTSWRRWVKLKNMETHRNIWQTYRLVLLSWWPFKAITKSANIQEPYFSPGDTNFPTSSFRAAVMVLRPFLVIVVVMGYY